MQQKWERSRDMVNGAYEIDQTEEAKGVKMQTGHNSLNKHEDVTVRIGSPDRQRCDERNGDSLHFLCERVALARQRLISQRQMEL